jgi:hypothetical protein
MAMVLKREKPMSSSIVANDLTNMVLANWVLEARRRRRRKSSEKKQAREGSR